MSISGGPDIIENGLVMYLDAADNSSYVSGSSTWYDISGNSNNGTLTNGPTFNSNNKGAIAFDAIDDYIDSPNFSSTILGSFSIFAWIKWNNVSSPSGQKIFHAQNGTPEVNLDNYSGGSGNPKIHFYTSATSSGNNVLTSGEDAQNGIWYYIVGVYDNSIKYKYLYVNGILKNSGSTSVQINWPNSSTRIGYRLNNSEAFNGSISQAGIYNRALSSNEILQNYNSIKGRYNL